MDILKQVKAYYKEETKYFLISIDKGIASVKNTAAAEGSLRSGATLRNIKEYLLKELEMKLIFIYKEMEFLVNSGQVR